MVVSRTVEFGELCNSIMSSDRNVRSVLVINQNGAVLHQTAHQKFVQPNLDRWNDTHFMECILEISMGGRFDEFYGPIRYHHSEKSDFIMFSFPFLKNVILVTCVKKVSPIAFATEVSSMIHNVINGILQE